MTAFLRATSALAGCAALAGILAAAPAAAQQPYFPPRHDWERRSPASMGIDAAKLRQAIDFANSIPTESWPTGVDLAETIAVSGRVEPYSKVTGPTTDISGVNGIIVKDGYVIAEWGETESVDMVFSVSKAFVSTVVGLAWDRDLIRELDDPVVDYIPPPDRALWASDHNARITWDHMLRQTSGWEGTLWGKPDWADRYEGQRRPRELPGEHWRYNDVRVNALALAALHVWRRPLPVVLRELVMDPIGASRTWEWWGYEDSWLDMDGLWVQSVAGGGHWGGGMFINAWDLARLGYMYLRGGEWDGQRIMSEEWIRMARTPTATNPTYGFMQFWLNTDKQLLPSAPESSFHFTGGSSNRVYMDPENDLLIVVRWIDGARFDGVVSRVLAALGSGAGGP